MFINFGLFTEAIPQFAAHEYQPFTHKDGQQHIIMFNFKGEESDVHRLYAVETPKNNNCGKTMKSLTYKALK